MLRELPRPSALSPAHHVLPRSAAGPGPLEAGAPLHPGVGLFLNRAPHYWDSETGENDSFTGKGHTNQVSRMTVDESGQLVSCSMDDTVRYTNLALRDYR